MKLKLFCIIIVILCLTELHLVIADFYFNHVTPKKDDLANLNLKCVPGRTVMRIHEAEKPKPQASYEEEEATDIRRLHTRFPPENDLCQICVCSLEGKDEYCSSRPAKNVNECMRMAMLMKEFNAHLPFDHERNLAFRIRRDYIWFNDEIPYQANARCQRGHSYYSNDINASNTTIDVGSDVESLLDYSNKDVCFFCVCSVSGWDISCITRTPWYCEYYRVIREGNAPRDMYRQVLQQDRPTYFRQLSYRLRRTMDAGMYDLVDSGGDTLCCDHPNGHRRSLHNQVRKKIRLLRNKVGRENLMSGAPGGDYVDFIVNND